MVKMESDKVEIKMKIGSNFGKLLTKSVRNRAWYNENVENTIKWMTKEFPDLTLDIIENIINGNSKFENADDIHLTISDDNWIPPNFETIIEELIKIKNGTRSYFNIHYHVQKHLCDEAIWLAEEAYNSFFRENDKKQTHKLYFDVLKEIENVKIINSSNTVDSILKHPMFEKLNTEKCIDWSGKMNGWIDQKGLFYACKHFQHDGLADELSEFGVETLEKTGWLRLSEGDWQYVGIKNKITNKQVDTVEKWQDINKNGLKINWNSQNITLDTLIKKYY